MNKITTRTILFNTGDRKYIRCNITSTLSKKDLQYIFGDFNGYKTAKVFNCEIDAFEAYEWLSENRKREGWELI